MAITEHQRIKLDGILSVLSPELNDLTDWERGFVKDQIERYEKYGTDIRLSDKQWAVLERLGAEYGGETGGDPVSSDDYMKTKDHIPF